MRLKNVDDLFTIEFIGENLFCILKHTLYIREYLAYFSYFRLYSKIAYKKSYKLLIFLELKFFFFF